MRRLFGVLLAGAILMLPALSQPAFAQQAAAPQKFTIDGDMAVLMVSVKADKTADYEQVLTKLKRNDEAAKLMETALHLPSTTAIQIHGYARQLQVQKNQEEAMKLLLPRKKPCGSTLAIS